MKYAQLAGCRPPVRQGASQPVMTRDRRGASARGGHTDAFRAGWSAIAGAWSLLFFEPNTQPEIIIVTLASPNIDGVPGIFEDKFAIER
jgi:hypothetical protein